MFSYLFKIQDPKSIIPFSNKSISIKVSQFEDTEIVKSTPISVVVNTVRILGILTTYDIEFLKFLDQETLFNIILEYNLALTYRLAMQNRNRYGN